MKTRKLKVALGLPDVLSLCFLHQSILDCWVLSESIHVFRRTEQKRKDCVKQSWYHSSNLPEKERTTPPHIKLHLLVEEKINNELCFKHKITFRDSLQGRVFCGFLSVRFDC